MRGRNRNFTSSISKDSEYSYARYAVRSMKDSYLQDDTEDFMAKHSTNLNALVDKLLDNRFEGVHYYDTTYPI
jgi:hypothetical protein